MHGQYLDYGPYKRKFRHIVALQEGNRPLGRLQVIQDLQELGHGKDSALPRESGQSLNIIKTTDRQRSLGRDELHRFCGFFLFFLYLTRVTDRLKLRYDFSRHFGACPVFKHFNDLIVF